MNNSDYQKHPAPEHVVLIKAPDLSDKIWQKHQSRKRKKWLAIAASCSICAMTFVVTSYNFDTLDIVHVNQSLEHQLADLSHVELSDTQNVIVNNWQDEIALIDEKLEQYDKNNNQLWLERQQLLTQIVEFKISPSDVYEI